MDVSVVLKGAVEFPVTQLMGDPASESFRHALSDELIEWTESYRAGEAVETSDQPVMVEKDVILEALRVQWRTWRKLAENPLVSQDEKTQLRACAADLGAVVSRTLGTEIHYGEKS
jgi:hypothetical protein